MGTIRFTHPRDYTKMSLGQRLADLVAQIAPDSRESYFRDTLCEARDELLLIERMSRMEAGWTPKGDYPLVGNLGAAAVNTSKRDGRARRFRA